MPRKKVEKKDFNALFENFQERVNANESLKNDPLLNQQLRDFQRMSVMNDQLWEAIQADGYTTINERTGVPVVNPAVAAFNKNASTCLKTAQWIDEKTKAVLLSGEEKSW